MFCSSSYPFLISNPVFTPTDEIHPTGSYCRETVNTILNFGIFHEGSHGLVIPYKKYLYDVLLTLLVFSSSRKVDLLVCKRFQVLPF